ncbi:unnamed protein product [Clavelina lepadiformis]|uniref:Uncharacterized protein n=1 Tax=Clavelina lepadiformis TaxID=159417 RepID=A0ABP0EVY9_CLALP
MARQNIVKDFQSEIQFMEEIVDEMLQVTNVDFKIKCQNFDRCLKHLALALKDTGYYTKSIETLKQGIVIMKLGNGNDAKLYHVFGQRHNNLGAAYEKDNQLMEAEKRNEAHIRGTERRKCIVGACMHSKCMNSHHLYRLFHNTIEVSRRGGIQYHLHLYRSPGLSMGMGFPRESHGKCPMG